MELTRIVFPEKGRVAVEKFEAEFHAGPGEIVLRTLFSYVSAGTELAKLTGLQEVAYPFVPGNRAIGEVLEVGPGVRRAKPGDIVFAHTLHTSIDKTSRFWVPVTEGVRLDQAPAVGMGLVAMTAVRMARPEIGDTAAVFGLGSVGNLAAQLMALSGCTVVGVDRVESRLETARKSGIQHLVNAGTGNVEEQVFEIVGKEGVDFVIEATGNPAVFESACNVARRQGEVVLVGSPRGEYPADLVSVLQRVHLWRDHGSLVFKGAHEWRTPFYPDGFAKHSLERNARILFDLMKSGRLVLDHLVTHVVPVAEAPRAFDGLLNDPDHWIGVVFDWSR